MRRRLGSSEIMDDHDDQQLVDFLWTQVKVRTGNSGRIFCGKQESGSKNSLGQSTQILPHPHCILAKKNRKTWGDKGSPTATGRDCALDCKIKEVRPFKKRRVSCHANREGTKTCGPGTHQSSPKGCFEVPLESLKRQSGESTSRKCESQRASSDPDADGQHA